jgi:hypothetical protein
MPYPRKTKPWRGHPASNHVHGIRIRLKQDTPDPARGEIAFGGIGAANAIPIGTVPAGCTILGVYRNVEVAFTATTTIDLGVAAAGTTLATSAVIAPQTVARGEVAMGVAGNMPTTDTVLWLTAGTLLPTAGTLDLTVRFYVNKD